MYERSAIVYDAIYSTKDYSGEAERLRVLIQRHKRSPGVALLDVACGSGGHVPHLKQHFEVEGLDLSWAMLELARTRTPDVTFHKADMADFDLGREFDVIVCLFSSIGYVRTATRLNQTLQTLSRHAVRGGVIIVEPWFTPEQWRDGHISADFVDQPELKVARMSVSRIESDLSILDLNFLVATRNSVEHFIERHELGLFTHEEYFEAFRRAELDVQHQQPGLIGRGLYVGVRP